jgi:hypothetical protein
VPQDLLHLIQGSAAVNEKPCILVPQEETARSKQMAAGSIPAWHVTAQVSALPQWVSSDATKDSEVRSEADQGWIS